ncbi:WD40 repeat domain-containing protein [Endozoicomonas arenosclerae]|uniref:WD40 repeat domain-containing protein n=1 Tax=Endozoicomonas arenosclerae TaxID=1633495 RepID=UPI0007867DBE|nr:WD40 repeat domain-containing protein [Endozoicomonas arenosclerae]
MPLYKRLLFLLFVLLSVSQSQARSIPPNYLVEQNTVYQDAEVLFSAFSHNGKLLATSSGNKVRLWRTDEVLFRSDAQPLAVLTHSGHVPTLSFSPDDQYLLTNSYDNTSKLWSVQKLTVLGGRVAEPEAVLSEIPAAENVRFNADGSLILSCSASARIWKVKRLLNGSGRRVPYPFTSGFVPDLHFDVSDCVHSTFSPDGKYIALALGDGTVRLWKTIEVLTQRESHAQKYLGRKIIARPVAVMNHGWRNVVYFVAFSHDGRKVLTSSLDKTARVWGMEDLVKGKAAELEIFQHKDKVVKGEFSEDDNLILTHTYTDRYYHYYSEFRDPEFYDAHLWPTNRDIAQVSPASGSGSASASGSGSGSGSGESNLPHMPPVRTTPLAELSQAKSTLSPDAQLLLSHAGDALSLRKVSELKALKGNAVPLASIWHNGVIWNAIFNPMGSLVVSSSADKSFRLFLRDSNVETGSGTPGAVTDASTGSVTSTSSANFVGPSAVLLLVLGLSLPFL